MCNKGWRIYLKEWLWYHEHIFLYKQLWKETITITSANKLLKIKSTNTPSEKEATPIESSPSPTNASTATTNPSQPTKSTGYNPKYKSLKSSKATWKYAKKTSKTSLISKRIWHPSTNYLFPNWTLLQDQNLTLVASTLNWMKGYLLLNRNLW